MQEKTRQNLMRILAYVGGVLFTIVLLLTAASCFASAGVRKFTINTDKAVIHHTATEDFGIDTFRKHHIENNGWLDIGYHFLIRADGSVEEGRPMTKPGAHAKGRNNWVGIALTGRDTFTEEQELALIQLLLDLETTYIERHHEYCPGPGLDVQAIQEIIKQ